MIRKILNNNFFAFFLVVPFTLCFLSSLFSPVFVSAAVSDPFSPDGGAVNINMSDDSFLTYKVRLENFMASYSLDVDDYYYFYANAGSNYTWIFPKDSVTIGYAFDGSVSVPVLYSDTWARSTLDRPISWETNNYSSFWTALKYQNGVYDITNIYDSSGVPTLAFPSGISPYCFISYINPPFVPSSNNGLSLGIDEDGFYDWLLETTKDSNFTPYLPLRRLFQYLQFYDSWGSSPQNFLIRYNIDYGDTIGSHLNNIQIIELKNLTDRLYREYLNSLKYPPADFPARDRVNIRKDIDTNTTDNNTVLITDDSNDSVIVSILRDILRGVIALRNQIFVTGTDIITGLNNLDFTVNVANNGGTGFDVNSIWGTGDITQSENYLALTAAFMDKGVDVSAAENMQINYLENATQRDSFTVSVVMPDQFVNGQFTEKTVTHTIDNTSKMYNTLILFRKLIAFAVVAYFAIRIRFELPHLIRGE